MTGAVPDPVTLAILKGRLEQIADETDATLYRSVFNPIIAEARDACHRLYHADTGATLVQGANGLARRVWRRNRGAGVRAVLRPGGSIDARRDPRPAGRRVCVRGLAGQ